MGQSLSLWRSSTINGTDKVADKGDRPSQGGLGDIFLQTKNYVSEHHKSISGGQNPFSFWGLRPQVPTKHFVHGLAVIFNACAVVISRSNCTRNVFSFGENQF
jgi:hypothetical protein